MDFRQHANARTARGGHFLVRVIGAILMLLGLTATGFTLKSAQASGPVVVIPIHGEIDLGIAPFLRRALSDAEQQDARAVILDINTPGGRLDAVLQMRDAILDSPVRTIAYVNREAFSAGALIAIAANEVYLAPGAVVGAATPVTGEGETASPKTISAVRSTFRSTAELRDRDPLIAEAMVDPAIAIPELVERGQLLTLTTAQARDVGYAQGVAPNLTALLDDAGLEGAPLREAEISLAERVVRFLTNPVVASLLTSVGFLLILADVYTGGFGALGLIGVALFALFFWGHLIAGLAGWEGIALTVVGLALIALEVFIPGFGVAGLLGIAALIGGLFMSLVGEDIITTRTLTRAASTVTGMLVFMLVGSVLLIRHLPRAAAVQDMILRSQLGQAETPPRDHPRAGRWHWLQGDRLEAHHPTGTIQDSTLLGAVGVALSDLRPGGIASIEGSRVDVVTRGDYISAGDQVEVIADEGYRRVVRRLTPQHQDSDVT